MGIKKQIFKIKIKKLNCWWKFFNDVGEKRGREEGERGKD